MAPRFRADHIGSLLRPQYLLEAQAAVSDFGQMHTKYRDGTSEDAIKKVQDSEKQAIKDVVNGQVKHGITPISNGEFDRASFVSGFFENLEGIEIRFLEWEDFRTDFPITRPYLRRQIPGRDVPIATGKVRFKQSCYMEEWMYTRSLLPEEKWKDVKVTIPAPNWSHTQLKDGRAYTQDAYSNDEEYLQDMGEAIRQEVLALYGAGVRFIQIDDPMVAMLCDQPYLDVQKSEGMDLKALLDPAIRAHNAIIKDLPSDLTLACHLCRGNLPKGDTAAVGSFEPLAERLFNETNYTRFALEFDDPEITGDFGPLHFLPQGKLVVLGLITTKDSELEKVEDMKAKIYEAADGIAKAQGRSREEVVEDSLAVSPGCGFASLAVITGTGMTEEIEFQKLGIVKKLAEEVFGST